MKGENGHHKLVSVPSAGTIIAGQSLHPAWRKLIRYCAEIQHGEIELLKIQDGLPVLAEKVKQKVKFT